MAIPSPEEQVHFLMSLQRLLDEGSFTSTYKYALLIAIADICVEMGNDTGDAMQVALTEIAEKFIQYYWRQAVPYPSSKKHEILYQSNGNQAAIINWLTKLHPKYQHSLARAKHNEGEWRNTTNAVALKVKEMPLKRLQVIAGEVLCFLYPHDVKDGQITLFKGVAFCFRRFHGMITRMVQSAWIDEIRALGNNQRVLGQKKDLAEFLFGSERASLSAYQAILREAQQGQCFYCMRPIRASAVIDHFIPWSRYPVDLGHNFMLAHAECNSSKGYHLAAYPHLKRWIARNTTYGQSLADEFDSSVLPQDFHDSHGIAYWAYEQNTLVNGLTWDSNGYFSRQPTEWCKLFNSSLPQALLDTRRIFSL